MDSKPVFWSNDAIFLEDGTLLQTHADHACAGQRCCIHNPSDHPLRDAQLFWWPNINFMDRICSHGQKHPDPDDVAFKTGRGTPGWLMEVLQSHDCDGCCRWPTEDKDARND